jgi:ribosomal RNA assembly protein
MAMIETTMIPEERKPVLIGKNGSVKKRIESETGTEISVGDAVEIRGEDSLRLMKAKDMVTAIGRGFTPKEASRLLDDDVELHVISLEGESLKKRKRLLGRVIGEGGRSRKRIERETGACICVRGKTLSIIGSREEIAPAEEAVHELLAGKTHAWAYRKMDMKKAGR